MLRWSRACRLRAPARRDNDCDATTSEWNQLNKTHRYLSSSMPAAGYPLGKVQLAIKSACKRAKSYNRWYALFTIRHLDGGSPWLESNVWPPSLNVQPQMWQRKHSRWKKYPSALSLSITYTRFLQKWQVSLPPRPWGKSFRRVVWNTERHLWHHRKRDEIERSC